MSKPKGKNVPVTPFRRLVIDLMQASLKVPTVTIDRPMNLAAVAAARKLCQPRPTWTAIFTKAYAIISARDPALRRCYMTIPWGRFFENPKTIATLNISRRVDDEELVLHAHIRSPENRTLTEIDRIVHHFKETPVEEIASFRRNRLVSYMPWPIRRLLFWLTLNLFGRRRCHNFGTFGITSVADRGAGILNLVPLLTSTLHYSLFDDKYNLDMRLAFDHRVIDGGTAATALADMDAILHGEILDELRSMRTVTSQAA